MGEQKDPKKACGACLDAVKLDEELYRLGNTKACLTWIAVFKLCFNVLIFV